MVGADAARAHQQRHELELVGFALRESARDVLGPLRSLDRLGQPPQVRQAVRTEHAGELHVGARNAREHVGVVLCVPRELLQVRHAGLDQRFAHLGRPCDGHEGDVEVVDHRRRELAHGLGAPLRQRALLLEVVVEPRDLREPLFRRLSLQLEVRSEPLALPQPLLGEPALLALGCPGRLRLAVQREARDEPAHERDGHQRPRRHGHAVATHELGAAVRERAGPRAHGLAVQVATHVVRQLRDRAVALPRLLAQRLQHDAVEVVGEGTRQRRRRSRARRARASPSGCAATRGSDAWAPPRTRRARPPPPTSS